MREFLAIPLPEPLRRRAAALCDILARPAESWRPVREDGLHITIRFLGEVDPARHARLDDAWREAAKGTAPLALRVCGASFAPNSPRPRVVWLTVRDDTHGGLARLAECVEQAARTQGFAPETRPFAGHVTLARARRGRIPRAAGLPDVSDVGTFLAERLVLYRSRLGPGGSVYEELSSYPFVPEGRP